jgi:GNAT superfamily N-acetyltransferase
MKEQELYTPFTGLTILEKSKLVAFLEANTENGLFSKGEITEAVECAVKERASLGGFILTLREGNEMLGALVVNATGMENRNPRHRLSLFAVARAHRHNGIAKHLLDKAVQQAGSNLAIQLEPGNGEVAFFEKLGFKEKYVEMRLEGGGS